MNCLSLCPLLNHSEHTSVGRPTCLTPRSSGPDPALRAGRSAELGDVRLYGGETMIRTFHAIAAIGILLSPSCSGESPEEPKWRTLEHANGTILVEYPDGWQVERKAHFVLIQLPGGEEAITLSAFTQPGSTLEEFSKARFSVEEEIYRPLGEPKMIETEKWSGITLVSQGVYPGESEETTRYMFCVCKPSVCASMTVYASPERFSRQEPLYDQVFRSLDFQVQQ